MEYYKLALRRYSDFSGRSSRSEFWYFVLFNLLVGIGVSIFVEAVGDSFEFLNSLYALAMALPSIAVSIRRLHDINRSGWWLLLHLIPLAGSLVVLIFNVQDGDVKKNKYGPRPKALK